jgi:hypothetical protein
MSDVSRILSAIEQGDPQAAEQLLPLVYEELRRLAAEIGFDPICLSFPALPAADLLLLVSEELGGIFIEPPTMAVAFRRLRDELSAAATSGHRLLLIVDEAHLINDPATFDAPCLLLNFTTTGAPDFDLLLIGTAELVLQLPVGLADRPPRAAFRARSPRTSRRPTFWTGSTPQGRPLCFSPPRSLPPCIASRTAFPAVSTIWPTLPS